MNNLTNLLDLRTTILVSVVIYIACTVLVIQLWRQNRTRFTGLGYLAINYSLQSIGLVALVARGALPEGISVLFTNLLISLGVVYGYYGLSLFAGKPQKLGMWFVLIAAFMLAQGYWYYVAPDIMWRKINASMILVVTGLLTAFFLLRIVEDPVRNFTKVAAWAYLAYTIFFVMRIILVFYEKNHAGGFFDSGSIESLLALFYPAMFVVLTYALSLMINRRLSWEAEQANAQVKVLSGLLPICAHCKKVRDDKGYWSQIETYISMHSEADFSHGYCPECEQKVYSDFS
jgi:uncharacterized membrane protein YhdT